jgi:hypothetical protein
MYIEDKRIAVLVCALIAIMLLTGIILSLSFYRPAKGGHTSGTNHTATTAYNAPSNQVIVDLVTWTSQNGYYSIEWNRITELDVFHAWVDSNGSLSYDGNLSNPNLTQVMSAAHGNRVRVVLAVGGAGESSNVIDSVLGNTSLGNALISNIVNETSAQGYDGVKIDFEGFFNQTEFTSFMQRLSSSMWAKNKNYIVAVNVAPWESSDFNITALSPYVTNFEVQFNPSLAELKSFANASGRISKVSAGYDLTNQSNFTDLEQNLVNDRSAGYGIFFYSLVQMNSTVWNAIASAETSTAK